MLVHFNLLSSAQVFGPPERTPWRRDEAPRQLYHTRQWVIIGQHPNPLCIPSCDALISINKVDLTH